MRLARLERGFLAVLGLWLAALAVMQLILGPGYRRAAEQNRIRLIPMSAVRGSLLDRHGVPIAEDRLSFNVAVIPQEVRDLEQVWATLTRRLGRPVPELRRAYRRGLTAPFAPVVVARDVDRDTAFAIDAQRLDWPGVIILPAPHRHYPLGEDAGPVIGYLGLVAPEQLTALKPYGYTPRDWVGQQGLERLYDAALRGSDGGVQVEVDHRGRLVRQLGLKRPIRGQDVAVTLDAALQRRAAALLAGRRGAIVVMALDTGELWAAASSPGFDPAAFVDPDRDAEVVAYLHDRDRPLFNRVVASTVPPGSVFKIVTAYAGLVGGRQTPGTTYDCPGAFHLGTATFDCWYAPGHGPQQLIEALAHSCNVFFYQWGLRAGPDRLSQTARLFGFGRPSRVDLPGEASGFVPDPAWKRARTREPWFRGETANLAIGQGSLLVTPMQVLWMTAAAALDGRVPQPHFLRAIGGHTVSPPPVSTAMLDGHALQQIRHGLEQVVASPTGTGRLAAIPAVAVAGKTGTAQAGRGATHAWFCGYAPAAAPRMAIVVFIEHGGKGGEVAAAMASQLFEALHAGGVVG